MINVIIYLKKEHSPNELVKFLLTEKLISSASIDENNTSYRLAENEIVKEIYNVITAQSKSLLFKAIINAVEAKIGEETPVFSTPIVGSNSIFDNTIRSQTIPT